MVFTKQLREGIRRGRIRCSVRIWKRGHVKVGERYRRVVAEQRRDGRMSIIDVAIDINAPLAVCFDIARSVDAHIESVRTTGERAVAGVTSGLLTLGDESTTPRDARG